jgi:cadmium resistance protein CadD (predicted permease)
VPKVPYLTDLDAFILISSLLVFLTLIEVIVTTTLVCNQRAALARKIDFACRFAFPLAYVLVTGTTLML